MKVNENSWHYKWLAYCNVMNKYWSCHDLIDDYRSLGYNWVQIYHLLVDRYEIKRKPLTFCQYWRDIAIVSPITIIINSIVVLIAGLAFFVAPMHMGLLMLIVIGLVTIAFGAIAIIIGADRAKEVISEKLNQPDSLVSNVYNQYKNSVCTLMEYENE